MDMKGTDAHISQASSTSPEDGSPTSPDDASTTIPAWFEIPEMNDGPEDVAAKAFLDEALAANIPVVFVATGTRVVLEEPVCA